MSKIQTQIRAELGWLWQQDETNTFLSDSGALRFRSSQSDIDTSNVEGVWQKAGQTLAANHSIQYELDYLNREIFGTAVQLSFESIRALEIVNRSAVGTLLIQPGDTTPWQAIWNQSAGQLIVPPGGTLLLSAGTVSWPVALLNNKLKLTALNADGLFDIALIGKIGSRASDSSASSAGSASSSGSAGSSTGSAGASTSSAGSAASSSV